MPTPQNGQTHSKQFAGNFPTNCLSAFDHFVGLTLKRVKGFLFNIEYPYYLEKNKTKIYCITKVFPKNFVPQLFFMVGGVILIKKNSFTIGGVFFDT